MRKVNRSFIHQFTQKMVFIGPDDATLKHPGPRRG